MERCFLWIYLRDHLWNTEIRYKTGIKDPEREIWTQKLRWPDHIAEWTPTSRQWWYHNGILEIDSQIGELRQVNQVIWCLFDVIWWIVGLHGQELHVTEQLGRHWKWVEEFRYLLWNDTYEIKQLITANRAYFASAKLLCSHLLLSTMKMTVIKHRHNKSLYITKRHGH